jgi:hypothetical protein
MLSNLLISLALFFSNPGGTTTVGDCWDNYTTCILSAYVDYRRSGNYDALVNQLYSCLSNAEECERIVLERQRENQRQVWEWLDGVFVF